MVPSDHPERRPVYALTSTGKRPQYLLIADNKCLARYQEAPNEATRATVGEVVRNLPFVQEVAWQDKQLVATCASPFFPRMGAIQLAMLLRPHMQGVRSLIIRRLVGCQRCQGSCLHWRLDIGASIPFVAPPGWRGWKTFNQVRSTGGFVTSMWATYATLSPRKRGIDFVTHHWVSNVLATCGLFSPGFASLHAEVAGETPS